MTQSRIPYLVIQNLTLKSHLISRLKRRKLNNDLNLGDGIACCGLIFGNDDFHSDIKSNSSHVYDIPSVENSFQQTKQTNLFKISML